MGNGCSKCCNCNDRKYYHGTLSSTSSVYRKRSRGELPIYNSDRFRITQTSNAVQLAVEHVQREDAGHYTLIARTKANDVIRKNIELIVEDRSAGEDPPVFARRLMDLSVKVGTRTRFLLEIRSSTEVKLTWYRNDRRICENDRIKQVQEGTYYWLEVSPVILEDGGQWMVMAENLSGRNSCICHLNVMVPKAYKAPEFVEELKAVLTEQGTVSLECKVVGVPTPQLRWFKDSKEIKAGDIFALTANANDPTSLGTYTCEAVNCMGKTYSSSKVHVVGRGSREGSLKPADSMTNGAPPPIFTNELKNASVRIGDSIVLGCQVAVPPWPKSVAWYNKNGRVDVGERYKHVEDGLGVYMIEINPSEACDEGDWKCVVTNNEGCVGISSCVVNMEIPKNYRKPRFMESLRAILTEEGLVSFECKVVGFPTPVLKWFKDGQELKPGDVYQLTGTNSLGTYCCVAKNCMGESSSVAVLTIEDIQNQLKEEDRILIGANNQPPKFLIGLKTQETKINEPFQFMVKLEAKPEPLLSWFRDEIPIEICEYYNYYRGEEDNWYLDIANVEFLDQAEWRCVAVNEFGTSVTSCFLKLQIPRHYKKPRFLESLRAVLTEEGAVNLECKVIGVPQPVLKWYKDGVELKPGDIHKIISGQDGTCCLGTYTCEARNCMGVVASSASLLGFEDAHTKQELEKQNELQRNFSLSTIQEERTSQLYETPQGTEVSFSFDGKEVSVSLYETPDLTEDEAIKIVEMYADQISEHVTEHNVVELPPLRFVKETSQSGKLLMEAMVIDISPEYFSHDEDLRTEAGMDDISLNEITIHGSSVKDEKELEQRNKELDDLKMVVEEEEAGEVTDGVTAPSRKRRKSKIKNGEEFCSPEKTISSLEEVDSSELQTFASAVQSPVDSSFYQSMDEGAAGSGQQAPPAAKKGKKDTGSETTDTEGAAFQDLSGAEGDGLIITPAKHPKKQVLSAEEIERNLKSLLPLAKMLKILDGHLNAVESEVIAQSVMLMAPSSADQSIAIIKNVIEPIGQIQSKLKVYSGDTPLDMLFETMKDDVRNLHVALQVIEKCVEIDETGTTLIQRTSVCIIDSIADHMIKALQEVKAVSKLFENEHLRSHLEMTVDDIRQGLEITKDTIKSQALLQEAQELEASKHFTETVAKLQDVPEPVPFEKVSDARLPKDAAFVAMICEPVMRIQEALERVENELTLEESDEDIYLKVHEKIIGNFVQPFADLQKVVAKIEIRANSLAGSNSMEYKINMAILDIVSPPLFELKKGLEIIQAQPSHNIEAGKLTVSTVESMVPPLQEMQNGLAQLSQDIMAGHLAEEAFMDTDDMKKLLQSLAQAVLHLETNIENINQRLPENVSSSLSRLKEEISSLISQVIDKEIDKYHLTVLENIKRPIDELNYCIRQIEQKAISGSLTDLVDPLHSLNDKIKVSQGILDLSPLKQNEDVAETLFKIRDLIKRIEIGIEEAEFKSLQKEIELDEQQAAKEQNLFAAMRQEMELKIDLSEGIKELQSLMENIGMLQEMKYLDHKLESSLVDLKSPLQRMSDEFKHQEIQGVDIKSLMASVRALKVISPHIAKLNMSLEKLGGMRSREEFHKFFSKNCHNHFEELKMAMDQMEYFDESTGINLPISVADTFDKTLVALENLISKCLTRIHDTEELLTTLEEISPMHTTIESLPSDYVTPGPLQAFEEKRAQVDQLLGQLKQSIASVLGHCQELDSSGSVREESQEKLKNAQEKIHMFQETLERSLQSPAFDKAQTLSEVSQANSIAEAITNLEYCALQIQEFVKYQDVQSLKEEEVFQLKAMAKPLKEIVEAVRGFYNQELEQAESMATLSQASQLSCSELLRSITPYLVAVQEQHALETLESLSERSTPLQQLIKPLRELEKSLICCEEQILLSHTSSLSEQQSMEQLKVVAKPLLLLKEAIVMVKQEHSFQSLQQCPDLRLLQEKQQCATLFNLLKYCENLDTQILENIDELSSLDLSEMKSMAEMRSVTPMTPAGPAVISHQVEVKTFDLKDCVAGGIKQLEECLESTKKLTTIEVTEIESIMQDLKSDLQDMQKQLLLTPSDLQQKEQQVAKTMFKLKECLVHTYEASGLDVGLEEIEKTFEDLLQAMPSLEHQLALEMKEKIKFALSEFVVQCLQHPEGGIDQLVPAFRNLLETLEIITKTQKVEIEPSSSVIVQLQTQLMAAFNTLNDLSEVSRDATMKGQLKESVKTLLYIYDFIENNEGNMRIIELLQEIDALSPQLKDISRHLMALPAAVDEAEMQLLFQQVNETQTFLTQIQEGLVNNNPLVQKFLELHQPMVGQLKNTLIQVQQKLQEPQKVEVQKLPEVQVMKALLQDLQKDMAEIQKVEGKQLKAEAELLLAEVQEGLVENNPMVVQFMEQNQSQLALLKDTLTEVKKELEGPKALELQQLNSVPLMAQILEELKGNLEKMEIVETKESQKPIVQELETAPQKAKILELKEEAQIFLSEMQEGLVENKPVALKFMEQNQMQVGQLMDALKLVEKELEGPKSAETQELKSVPMMAGLLQELKGNLEKLQVQEVAMESKAQKLENQEAKVAPQRAQLMELKEEAQLFLMEMQEGLVENQPLALKFMEQNQKQVGKLKEALNVVEQELEGPKSLKVKELKSLPMVAGLLQELKGNLEKLQIQEVAMKSEAPKLETNEADLAPQRAQLLELKEEAQLFLMEMQEGLVESQPLALKFMEQNQKQVGQLKEALNVVEQELEGPKSLEVKELKSLPLVAGLLQELKGNLEKLQIQEVTVDAKAQKLETKESGLAPQRAQLMELKEEAQLFLMEMQEGLVENQPLALKFMEQNQTQVGKLKEVLNVVEQELEGPKSLEVQELKSLPMMAEVLQNLKGNLEKLQIEEVQMAETPAQQPQTEVVAQKPRIVELKEEAQLFLAEMEEGIVENNALAIKFMKQNQSQVAKLKETLNLIEQGLEGPKVAVVQQFQHIPLMAELLEGLKGNLEKLQLTEGILESQAKKPQAKDVKIEEPQKAEIAEVKEETKQFLSEMQEGLVEKNVVALKFMDQNKAMVGKLMEILNVVEHEMQAPQLPKELQFEHFPLMAELLTSLKDNLEKLQLTEERFEAEAQKAVAQERQALLHKAQISEIKEEAQLFLEEMQKGLMENNPIALQFMELNKAKVALLKESLVLVEHELEGAKSMQVHDLKHSPLMAELLQNLKENLEKLQIMEVEQKPEAQQTVEQDLAETKLQKGEISETPKETEEQKPTEKEVRIIAEKADISEAKKEEEKPKPAKEPYLEEVLQTIHQSLDHITLIQKIQLNQAQQEVVRSIADNLKELQTAIEEESATRIEDRLFLTLFKTKELLKCSVLRQDKYPESVELLKNFNKVFILILNGNDQLRKSILYDLKENISSSAQEIITVAEHQVPGASGKLGKLCQTLEGLKIQLADIHQNNRGNMKLNSEHFQKLQESVQQIEQLTEGCPDVDRQPLTSLAEKLKRQEIQDALEILQELDNMQGIFKQIVQLIVDNKFPQKSLESSVEMAMEKLSTAGEESQQIKTDLQEALESQNQEEKRKCIFKLREHIVHTYDGSFREELENVVDSLLEGNTELIEDFNAESLQKVEELLNCLKEKVELVPSETWKPKLEGLNSKLSNLQKVSETLKASKDVDKSTVSMIELQKNLMDIFVMFDDMLELKNRQVEPRLEEVKSLALKQYDEIEKSTENVRTLKVYEDILKLGKAMEQVLEMVSSLAALKAELLEESQVEAIAKKADEKEVKSESAKAEVSEVTAQKVEEKKLEAESQKLKEKEVKAPEAKAEVSEVKPEKVEEKKVEAEAKKPEEKDVKSATAKAEVSEVKPEKAEEKKVETEPKKTEEKDVKSAAAKAEVSEVKPERAEEKKVEAEAKTSEEKEVKSAATTAEVSEVKPEKAEEKKVDVETKKPEEKDVKSAAAKAEVSEVKLEKVEEKKVEAETKKTEEKDVKPAAAKVEVSEVKPEKAEEKKVEADVKKPEEKDVKSAAAKAEVSEVKSEKVEEKKVEVETKKPEEKDVKSTAAKAEVSEVKPEKAEEKKVEADAKKPEEKDVKSTAAKAEVSEVKAEKAEEKKVEAEAKKPEEKDVKSAAAKAEVSEVKPEKAEEKKVEADAKKSEEKDVKSAAAKAEVSEVKLEKVEEKKMEAETKKPEEEDVKSAAAKAEVSEVKPEKAEEKKVEAEAKKPEEKDVKSAAAKAEVSEVKPEKAEEKKMEAESKKPEEKDVKSAAAKAEVSEVKPEKAEEKKVEAEPKKPEEKDVKSAAAKAEVSEVKPEKVEEKKMEAESKKPEEKDVKSAAAKAEVSEVKPEKVEDKKVEAGAKKPEEKDVISAAAKAEVSEVKPEKVEEKKVETEPKKPEEKDVKSAAAKAEVTEVKPEKVEEKKVESEPKKPEEKDVKTAAAKAEVSEAEVTVESCIEKALHTIPDTKECRELRNALEEALQSTTEEQKRKSIFRLRETIVHTYDGRFASEVDSVIDALLENNPDLIESVNREHLQNIESCIKSLKLRVDSILIKPWQTEFEGLNSKLSAIQNVAASLRPTKDVHKSSVNMVELQKNLMDIFVMFDDMLAIKPNAMEAELEQVKKLALGQYDAVENAKDNLRTLHVYEDIMKLCKSMEKVVRTILDMAPNVAEDVPLETLKSDEAKEEKKIESETKKSEEKDVKAAATYAEVSEVKADKVDEKKLDAEAKKLDKKEVKAESVKSEVSEIKAEQKEEKKLDSKAKKLEKQEVKAESAKAEVSEVKPEKVEEKKLDAEAKKAEKKEVKTEAAKAEVSEVKPEKLEEKKLDAEVNKAEKKEVKTEAAKAEVSEVKPEKLEEKILDTESKKAEKKEIKTETTKPEVSEVKSEKVEEKKMDTEAKKVEKKEVKTESSKPEVSEVKAEQKEEKKLETETKKLEEKQVKPEPSKAEVAHIKSPLEISVDVTLQKASGVADSQDLNQTLKDVLQSHTDGQKRQCIYKLKELAKRSYGTTSLTPEIEDVIDCLLNDNQELIETINTEHAKNIDSIIKSLKLKLDNVTDKYWESKLDGLHSKLSSIQKVVNALKWDKDMPKSSVNMVELQKSLMEMFVMFDDMLDTKYPQIQPHLEKVKSLALCQYDAIDKAQRNVRSLNVYEDALTLCQSIESVIKKVSEISAEKLEEKVLEVDSKKPKEEEVKTAEAAKAKVSEMKAEKAEEKEAESKSKKVEEKDVKRKASKAEISEVKAEKLEEKKAETEVQKVEKKETKRKSSKAEISEVKAEKLEEKKIETDVKKQEEKDLQKEASKPEVSEVKAEKIEEGKVEAEAKKPEKKDEKCKSSKAEISEVKPEKSEEKKLETEAKKKEEKDIKAEASKAEVSEVKAEKIEEGKVETEAKKPEKKDEKRKSSKAEISEVKPEKLEEKKVETEAKKQEEKDLKKEASKPEVSEVKADKIEEGKVETETKKPEKKDVKRKSSKPEISEVKAEKLEETKMETEAKKQEEKDLKKQASKPEVSEVKAEKIEEGKVDAEAKKPEKKDSKRKSSKAEVSEKVDEKKLNKDTKKDEEKEKVEEKKPKVETKKTDEKTQVMPEKRTETETKKPEAKEIEKPEVKAQKAEEKKADEAKKEDDKKEEVKKDVKRKPSMTDVIEERAKEVEAEKPSPKAEDAEEKPTKKSEDKKETKRKSPKTKPEKTEEKTTELENKKDEEKEKPSPKMEPKEEEKLPKEEQIEDKNATLTRRSRTAFAEPPTEDSAETKPKEPEELSKEAPTKTATAQEEQIEDKNATLTRRPRTAVAEPATEDSTETKPKKLNEYIDLKEQRSAKRMPSVDIKLTNRNTSVGSDIKLTCSISGNDLEIRWYKDKQPIDAERNASKYRITQNDGLSCLEIKSADQQDAAVYRCVAANRNGEVETSCLVTLYDVPSNKFGTPPIFTRNIRDAYHSHENRLTLECKVSGNPKPTVYWQKDNTRLDSESKKYQYVDLADGITQLVIESPEPGDTGLYTCYAESESGQMKISKFVDVSDYKPKLPELKVAQKDTGDVVTMMEKSDKTMEEEREERQERKLRSMDAKFKLTVETPMKPMVMASGTKAQLICYVSGFIEDVYWLRGNERVTKDSRHKIYNINGALSLEIYDARPDDTAQYKCVVKNSRNSVECVCDLTIYDSAAEKLPSSFSSPVTATFDADRCEIILSCMLHGRPTVTWIRDDHTISNNRYRVLEELGGISKLIIRNPIPSDCGTFSCFAETNERIEAITKIIRINDLKKLMAAAAEQEMNGFGAPKPPVPALRDEELEEQGTFSARKSLGRSIPTGRKPLFSSLLHDRTMTEGGNLRLSCSVVYDGQTTVEWTKNGRALPNDSRYYTTFHNGEAILEIVAVEEHDSGQYMCRALNDYGDSVSQSNIRIYKHYENTPQPATFVQSIRDTYSLTENELVLDCRVRGKPRPEVQWLKGTEILIPGEKYTQIDSDDGHSKLIIHNPTEKDAGLYGCIGRNEAAETKITHQVDFRGREKFALEQTLGFYHRDPNKPHLVAPLGNQVVCGGGTIAISAEFMQTATPIEVQWFRQRQPLAGQPGVKTFYERGVYTLAIMNAGPEHEGSYTCRAQNAFGRIESHATVDVAIGVEKAERPPLFLSRPETEMKIAVGDPFSISFRIAGDPKPKLTFMKGTKDITKSDRVSKEVSDDYTRFTVQKSQISDSGTYFVVARNNNGTDRIFVTVDIKTPKKKD